MVTKRSTGVGRKKRRPGRPKKTTVAELLSAKDTDTVRKTKGKQAPAQAIPDIIKETNDKNVQELKDSKKSTQTGTNSNSANQKQFSSDIKRRGREIQGVVVPSIVYLSSSSLKRGPSNTVKAIQLTHNTKQDKQVNAENDKVKNAVPSQTRRIIVLERKNSETQPKTKASWKQTIPPHYLKTSADDSTPKWKGPLRNYSRVKAGNETPSKPSDLPSTISTNDQSGDKDSLQNHSLVKNSDSGTDASVPNFSEICEKLANAGSSITDSLSLNTAVHRKIKSAEGKLSSHKTQMQKNSPSNTVSSPKITSSAKIKMSFIKSNSLSSPVSPDQGSDSGIKNNNMTGSVPSVLNVPLQKELNKMTRSTNLSTSEKSASSSIQEKSGKNKSPISKTSTEPLVSKAPLASFISSKEITVYPHSSLKKSVAAKSSESSLIRPVAVSSSRKLRADTVDDCRHEDSLSDNNMQSPDQATHVSDGHRSSSFKRAEKKTSRKRSFDECDESMDNFRDANVTLTKYFADPDFHFLMSLMPFLKKMNLSDRLKARIKIQEVIYDVGNFDR